MRNRVYIAASLDGYVATADGGVGWLEAFQDGDYGYESFAQQIDTLVVGRATYNQVLGFGEWPYAGKRVYVLTSSPLESSPPPLTSAWLEGVEPLIARLHDEQRDADTWVMGGPETIQAFLERGAIDAYEVFLMPVLLGTGIPLFPRSDSATQLRLLEHRVYADGVGRLVYEPG